MKKKSQTIFGFGQFLFRVNLNFGTALIHMRDAVWQPEEVPETMLLLTLAKNEMRQRHQKKTSFEINKKIHKKTVYCLSPKTVVMRENDEFSEHKHRLID